MVPDTASRRKTPSLALLNVLQYHKSAVTPWTNVRHWWLNALNVGPIILLLALLPSVSYVDHWSEFASSVSGKTASEIELDIGEQSPSGVRQRDPTSGVWSAMHHHQSHTRPDPPSAVALADSLDPARSGTRAKPVRSSGGSPEDTSHVAHCHANVATCSDQPVPADLRLLQAIIELEQPDLVETARHDPQIGVAGYVSSIPTEPPRQFA